MLLIPVQDAEGEQETQQQGRDPYPEGSGLADEGRYPEGKCGSGVPQGYIEG
jgi:hypothetical protein